MVGYNSEDPVFAFDFKSLYPSIIIGYNLSPYNIHNIRHQSTINHNHWSKTEENSSISMPKTEENWSKTNEIKCEFEDGSTITGKIKDWETTTLYPFILQKLFDTRAEYVKISQHSCGDDTA